MTNKKNKKNVWPAFLARRFGRDEAGGVILMFSLMLAVFVTIAAGAVEITRRNLAEAELQNGLDAASLAGRLSYERAMNAGSTESVARTKAEAEARAMFASAMAQSKQFGADTPPMTLKWTKTTLEATSDASFKRVYEKLIPSNLARIRATSVAEMAASTPFEVALILDNSRSMLELDGRTESRLSLLRAAAKNFVHDMFDYALAATGLDTPVRMAVVPWAVSVNAKTETPAAKNSAGVRLGTVVSDLGSGKPVANPNLRLAEVELDTTIFASNAGWKGCLVGNIETRVSFTESRPAGKWRSLGIAPTQHPDPNASCPTPMLGLSANRMQVIEHLDRMTIAEGGTHADVGMRWGLRALSPAWSSFFGSDAAAAYKGKTKKVAVLITDGRNEEASWVPGFWNCSNPYDPTCVGTPARSELNTMMLGWCQAMRETYGIDVYTIALNISDSEAIGYLRDCVAPNVSRAFSIDSANVGQALKAIFQETIRLKLTH